MKKNKKAKQHVRWGQGRAYYDDTTKPPKPSRLHKDDYPDSVFAGMAALVQYSHEVEGHEERMAAHMARVAREDVKGNTAELTCDACGVVAPRADNMMTPDTAGTGERWVCRKIAGAGNETYCRECFAVWGWPDEYRLRVKLFARGLIRPDAEAEVA